MRWVVVAWTLLACGCGRISFDTLAPAGDARNDASDASTACVGSACNCVVEVVAGEQHVCVRLPDGSVQCAGNNAFAQLGTSAITPMELQPVVATVWSTALELVAGRDYTCVRSSSGAACVGDNNDRQLDGVGGPTTALTPLSPVTAPLTRIVAGNAFVCAIETDGDVICWGDSDEGEGGRGMSPDSHPPELAAIGVVTAISAGTNHVCAVHNSQGSLSCWGDARLSRLGTAGSASCPIATDGAISCTTIPTMNTGVPNPAGVAAGHEHSCAWTTGGDVYCWGGNDNGQLGRTASVEEGTAIVVGIDSATTLAAGRDHTCAIKTDRSVWCWGDANAGQLGAGQGDSFTPVNVPLPAKATALVAHPMASFTCAHLDDDTAYCWGRNSSGQLGRGTMESRAEPAPFQVTCP